jgi:hypothetical protein
MMSADAVRSLLGGRMATHRRIRNEPDRGYGSAFSMLGILPIPNGRSIRP